MAANNPLKQSAIVWSIAAATVSIFTCFFTHSVPVEVASVFMKILAALAGTIAGVVCALIGDALRRAVHPDVVITNGGFFSLLGTKLFWAVGPQLVGLGIGVFFAIAIVLR